MSERVPTRVIAVSQCGPGFEPESDGILLNLGFAG